MKLNDFLESKKSRTAIIIAILVIGLLVRLGYTAIYHDPVTSDSAQYDALAVNMLNGQGYVLNNSMDTSNMSAYANGAVPSAWRPPGYPLFLAMTYKVFGHSYVAVHILQILISILTAYIIFLIGRRLWSVEAGLVGMLFFCLWPPFIVLTSQLLTETLNNFLILLGLLISIFILEKENYMNWWLWIILGLVVGYSSIVRPTYLLYPFFLAFAFIVMGVNAVRYINRVTKGKRKEDVRRYSRNYFLGVGIILLISVVIIGGWAARNYTVFHGFVPGTTMQGLGVYFGTKPFNVSINGNPDSNDMFYQSVMQEPGNELEKSRMLTDKGIENFVNDPFSVVWNKLGSLYNIWRYPYIANTIDHPSYDIFAKNNEFVSKYMPRGSVPFFVFLYGYIFIHVAIIIIFILSLFLARWWRDNRIVLAYCTILYLDMMMFVTIGIDRYVLAAMPIIVIAAANLVIEKSKLLKHRKKHRS